MTTNQTVDYAALANQVDSLREVLRATVAGLVQDGFTDREARAIVAGMLAIEEDDQ